MKKHINHHQRAAACMAALLGLSLLTAATAHAQNGTWTNLVGGDASGSWATAANWNNGTIAGGADNTADFSTLDLTTNSTVTLDGDRTIGHLLFGDTTLDNSWSLTGNTLTLSTTTANPPTVTVNNPFVTNTTVIAGTQGWTERGLGAFILRNQNSTFEGNLVITQGMVAVVDPVQQVRNYLGSNTVFNGGLITNLDGTLLTNSVVARSGGTIGFGPNVRYDNKAIYIQGEGVGGAYGAFYVNATGTTTGTRLASSTANPALVLLGDATYRVDGNGINPLNGAEQVLQGRINLNGFTLTKTGLGALSPSVQGGTSLVGPGVVHVMEGSLATVNNAVKSDILIIVDAGARMYCGRPTFSSGASLTINGLWAVNNRGNGTVGSDTGTANEQIGALNGSGTITTGLRGNTGLQTLSINNGVFSGSITNDNGTIAIVKIGAGTLTLSGENGYAGATTVNAGTLLIDGGQIGNGGFAVNFGGTLGGGGTIASTITNAGTIAPTSGGTLTALADIVGNYADIINIADSTLAVSGKIGPDTTSLIGMLTLSNGTLQLPLDLANPSARAYNMNVDASSVIRFTTETPALGQYPIISYASLGGLVGFPGLSVSAPAGVTAVLSNNTANSTIDVVITAIPALTWKGNVNGDWDIGITPNWQAGATPAVWNEPGGVGLLASFDDTATTTAVNVATGVNPTGITVDNSNKAYSFSGIGSIIGTGGLLKSGSGTLTVANDNLFSGAVTINQGTVQVGNAGTSGSLGSGPLNNAGTLAMNRSDDFALGNIVSGNGALTKAGANTATVPFSGDSTGAVTVNAGTLQVGPTGTSKFSGSVTGSGAFGVNGAGTVVLNGFNNTYAGGTVISSGTLQFGDEFALGALPPAGNITDNGTLATTISGILPNNITGSGGLSIISNALVTLSGVNTYSGPTVVLGGTLTPSTVTSLSPNSLVQLGSLDGTESGNLDLGTLSSTISGLAAGGTSILPTIAFGGTAQTLTINGNVSIGNQRGGATGGLGIIGGNTAKLVVNTNGGTMQLGLCTTPSGQANNLTVDFSSLAGFAANLGTNGTLNVGDLNGNTGGGSQSIFTLSASNVLNLGTIGVGVGGKGFTPQLVLGTGSNILNVSSVNIGTGGRDSGLLAFAPGSGTVTIRGFDGGNSRAALNVGTGGQGTSGSATNMVDLSGHDADLLLSTLTLGDQPSRAGVWSQTFSFNQGVLDASTVSLSPRVTVASAALGSSSTMNLGGGTVTFGPVSLTASAAAGTLYITGGNVTVAGIKDTGAGTGTLDISGATLNLNLPGFGNPASAPVSVDVFNTAGTVSLKVNATGLSVGQFPLIKYTGAIGGGGYPALSLVSLPANVLGSLSNNTANQSVDLVITSAPFVINPNPTDLQTSVSGGQLELSWPADHIGWGLYSNTVSVANSAAWYLVPGSTTTNQVSLPIDPAITNVFYRMQYNP